MIIKFLSRRVASFVILLPLAGPVYAIDPSCDASGKKYTEMIKNGQPLSKQDEACFRATWTANEMARIQSTPIPKVTNSPAPSWSDLGKKH